MASRYGYNGGIFCGRDDGVTVWGNLLNGKLGYSAGVFEGHTFGVGALTGDQGKPMYAAPLQYDFWDAEPGYYGTGNYLGAKDILAIGIAGRHQKSGVLTLPATGDYSSWNIDFLLEKRLAGADFLVRWPTLGRVKLARKATLEAFLNEHNVRRAKRIEQRIGSIKAAVPFTNDSAVIAAYQLLALAVVDQLRAVLLAIERFDEQIAAIAPTLPDYALFSALRGAGAVLAPRLLVAFGEQRERFHCASEFQQYCGVAPVVDGSGQKFWVHWRWQCSKFLRQTMVEWSAQTITRSFWAGAYYRQQRDKGNSHQVAVRALAYKWIRILYAAGRHARLTMNRSI